MLPLTKKILYLSQDEAVMPSFLSTSTVGCHLAMKEYCARCHAGRASWAQATSYVNSANSDGAVSPLLAVLSIYISLQLNTSHSPQLQPSSVYVQAPINESTTGN